MTMKWHKFLVNFGLWAGAAVTALMGVTVLNGMQYDGNADQVYRAFRGLEEIDKLYGMLLIAQAVFTIVVRFRLAKMRRSGITFLLATYWVSLGVELIYAGLASAMIHADLFELLSGSGSTFASAVVGFLVNRSYYKNREHLFTSD